MADYWVPYAQENDMVLVLPQVNHCWDVGQFNEFDAVGGIISTEENEVNDHLTKNGFQMEFMNQIIEQVKKPLDEKVEYIFEASDDGFNDINYIYRWNKDDEPNYYILIGFPAAGLVLLCAIVTCCYRKLKKRSPTFAHGPKIYKKLDLIETECSPAYQRKLREQM